MGGNKLTDTALQFLRQMPQLEYLDISGQQRTDSGLWSLMLTETGMQSIASATELRELRIGGTAVTTRGSNRSARSRSWSASTCKAASG